MTPSSWYAAVALPFALAFAFLTPPLQSPDEVAHYWRAVAISRGQLLAEKFDGKPGGMLPADVRDLVFHLWMERPATYDTSRLDRALTLRPSSESVRLVYSAFYTAVPYLPQAAAVGITRLANAPTLVSFYAGRVANALAGVLLVMLAMRIAPNIAWAFGAIGLTPMFLFLAGTFSADVVTTGLAFCTAAAAVSGSARLLAATAIPLSLAKPAYFLVAFIAPRKRLLAVLALVVAGVALAAWTTSSAYYPMRPDVFTDARQQSAHVMHFPLRFLRVAAADYLTHAPVYFEQLTGRLGWLDVFLPRFIRIAFALLFAYLAATMNVQLRLRERLLVAAAFVATLLIVSLSQYLIWTPVNADEIHGIQGRYFLPVFPLLLIAIAKPVWKLRIAVPLTVAAVANLAALYAVAARYYETFQ